MIKRDEELKDALAERSNVDLKARLLLPLITHFPVEFHSPEPSSSMCQFNRLLML